MKRNIALSYFSRPVKGTPGAEALAQACAERGWTPEWYERGESGWKTLSAQLERSHAPTLSAGKISE